MHVLVIAQYFPPDIGGSATRAYNLAKGLLLNGCEVTVIAAYPHYPHGDIPKEYRWKPFKVEWMGGVRVIRTFMIPVESAGLAKRMLLFGCFAISSLFPLPLLVKIDVVWASNPDIIDMIPAAIYSRVKGTPSAINVDDLAVEDMYDLKLMKRGSLPARMIELVTRVSYRNAKLITPISPGYVEPISSKYGVNKEKIRVVRGGVDLTLFKPTLTGHRNGNRFTVLYSGSFSLAYNFDQVFLAAELIQEKDSEVEFVLQGKGELSHHIKSKIRELDLKNVKVIDEVISRSEVSELLNQADVLLLPLGDFGKPHLGISAKLYEYQAVGKPIVCCSSGMPGVYVSETKSGYVIRPGDYEAMAEKILFLKENRIFAVEFGKNGRQFVENNLSIEKIGLETKTLLQTLLKSRYHTDDEKV